MTLNSLVGASLPSARLSVSLHGRNRVLGGNERTTRVHICAVRPFKLGLGDYERGRAAACERTDHKRRFIEMCRGFSPFTMAFGV
jgi:hypothetical protein